LKIAIAGTRGIPNKYGGFERFAEQVSSKFADHGHDVTVYCRRAFTAQDDVYDRRVKRVIVPSIHQKHLDTWVSTFFALIHAAFARYDVILVCNVANAPLCYIPRVLGTPVVLNVDGLDRKRGKWNRMGAQVLHFCEWVSSFSPTRLVTDAKEIHDYYKQRYGAESTVIAYGSEMPAGDYSLNGFKLQAGRYVLYVSRLEPENNPELVLRSWRKVNTDWPLVMVGDNRYDPAYEADVRRLADGRVMFTGAVYGDGYWALQKHAGVFIFACEVGGVHPALIESMAAQNATLYLGTRENDETAGGAAVRYSKSEEDLAEKLQMLIEDEGARREWGSRAKERAEAKFAWEAVARKYEELFEEVAKSSE
jgi:glycosyltransferase involved in cell wall biosynthesis